MINIYKNLIENYINNMDIDDIKSFALKNNISISNTESIIIYNFIKINYKSILNGDESSFISLKQSLREDLYIKIMELYMHYKSKLFM